MHAKPIEHQSEPVPSKNSAEAIFYNPRMDFSFIFQFWVVAIAGRINEYQHAIIAYKDEEIRCLREQLKKATGKDRPHFTDTQRIRLAAKAKKLGRATVEVWHNFKLIRYLVLFVIDLPTRKVEIIGIAPEPDGQWMKQMARNMTDCFDGPLKNKTMLIHDRDPLFTSKFREILKASGVTCKKLPRRVQKLGRGHLLQSAHGF